MKRWEVATIIFIHSFECHYSNYMLCCYKEVSVISKVSKIPKSTQSFYKISTNSKGTWRLSWMVLKVYIWYIACKSTVQLLKESKSDISSTQRLRKVQLKYDSCNSKAANVAIEQRHQKKKTIKSLWQRFSECCCTTNPPADSVMH